MSIKQEPLSVNLRTTIGLLWVYVVAISLALIVTVIESSTDVRAIALLVVAPQIVILVVLIHYCGRRKTWGFAGAAVLGALGVLLRIAVSIQPTLEVGGGLPSSVTAVYIVLGSLVCLKGYESILELRT